MSDRVAELRAALKDAEANGWQSARSLLAVRATTHRTPDLIPEHWWPGSEYMCTEVLDFVFHRTDRVPICVYRVSHNPWTGTSSQTISYRRALDLLRQPLAQSTVHDR